LKPEPLFAAIEALAADGGDAGGHVVLMTPQGEVFSQQMAQALASRARLLLVCGHYEGIDERVREHAIDQELSIGDYVLSGGELPAMVVIDAVVRLLPGALGSPESPVDESHASGLLEYPQYTRPAEFRGWRVPEVLLSGNHAVVARWRREQSVRRTILRRPDLARAADIIPGDDLLSLADPAPTPGSGGPTSTTAEPAP
jgi:tRNA (guanine37-N1)-methyltransferase